MTDQPKDRFSHCPRKDCGIILASNQLDPHIIEYSCPRGHYSCREATGGFASWTDALLTSAELREAQ